nr:uncharacterized protein LOC127325499 isoform X1 [Lolium perenne]
MRPDLLVVGEFGSAAMEVARSRAPRPAPIEVSGHPSTIRCCRHAPRLQVAPARGVLCLLLGPERSAVSYSEHNLINIHLYSKGMTSKYEYYKIGEKGFNLRFQICLWPLTLFRRKGLK